MLLRTSEKWGNYMAISQVMMEIGERLRAQRKKMGLTQEETAELLEMSTTFYGEIERGNRRLSIEKIILVYRKMGLEPTYLLTGEVLSNRTLVEIFNDCPKEKEPIVEQVLRYLTLLYK